MLSKIILKGGLSLVGIGAGILAAAGAQAAVITTDYSFSGSNFGPSAPYAALNGTFSIDFDTTAHAFSLASLALTIGAMSYDTTNSGLTTNGSLLYVGGNATQPSGISSLNSNDFLIDFTFDAATGALKNFNVFKYAVKGHLGLLQAGTFSYSVVPAAVPEPATWLAMIGGFGMIGAAMRRRRRTSVNFA